MAQCTAKAKSTGSRCKNAPVPGRTTCRFHGGLTPRGPASPHWKHGRYSKVMPTGLLALNQELLADRELLDLTDEIGVARTRLASLLGRVGSNEARRHWDNLDKYVTQLITAIRKQDPEAINDAIALLQSAVRSSKSDYAAWGEIMETSERVRRLVDSESRRRKDMQSMIYAEAATNLMVFLGLLGREFVPKNRLHEYTERLMEYMHKYTATDT